ncbi:MAG: histone deacetylase [Pseudomonadota bacterium]
MKFIDTYYTPSQVSNPESSSPSPLKPALVVADWLEHALPIWLIEPVPVTRDQLTQAHAASYVEGVLDCTLPNGFRGRQRDVAESLPWTCGSLLSAAEGALNNGQVACSPTSGFHHAGYSSGYGYCTFNGLMVAALVLKAAGRVRRVGILDCDQHYGDGTAEIIDHLGIRWIEHVSQEHYGAEHARPFLDRLPEVVAGFKGCDLLIYQAGADAHIKDPLGGFMTTAQLADRDRIVFTGARDLGLPVVWDLAGGYQEPISRVLDIHRNTMSACADVYL